MNRGEAVAAVDPEPVFNHPMPQGLAGNTEAMQLRQLLSRQRRSKVRISFTNQRHCQFSVCRRQPTVARATSVLGDEPGRPIFPDALQEPENLTALEAYELSRILDPQSAGLNIKQNL
jgi:hypothetical protein